MLSLISKLLKATFVVAGLCAFCAAPCFGSRAAVTVAEPSTGIKVQVTRAGSYGIISSNPDWTFGGHLGARAIHIVVNRGTDTIGSYQEIAFEYAFGGMRRASIRTYQNRPAVLFQVTYETSRSNTGPFPAFSTFPTSLHHLSFDGVFAGPSFTMMGPTSPWIFFDDSAATFIVSAASDFMVANTSMTADGTISCGIDPAIGFLPRGFTHRTLWMAGNGVESTLSKWGNALTDLSSKTRPANDAGAILKYLGYWTDHGAAYYYHFDPALGYAGTLLAVKDYFNGLGIPLGYMQLDSWWYPKGPDAHWTPGDGIYQYVAHPAVLPDGLQAFQQKLGLPLVTHARWIDSASPYRSQYTMSNNVSVDPRYWDAITAYIKDGGAVTYEQDWLNQEATAAETINDQEAFMGNMAGATAANGLSVQYCMAEPRHFLQSTKYVNVTTIRVSGDRFEQNKWDSFLYTSALAGSVGLWPWSDVFMSTEKQNLLLSNLSGGVVGIGDPIGGAAADNLLLSVRGDGVIVKPDVPAVPSDSTIIADFKGLQGPMVAYTYTDFALGRAVYVVSLDRGSGSDTVFTPYSVSATQQSYLYDFFTGRGRVISPGEQFSAKPDGGFGYYILTPIGPSGIGFLGDAGKFVSLGKQRITSVADDGTLRAGISFGLGENVVLIHGYSPTPPSVAADHGSTGPVTYDSASGLFGIPVYPASDDRAAISIAL